MYCHTPIINPEPTGTSSKSYYFLISENRFEQIVALPSRYVKVVIFIEALKKVTKIYPQMQPGLWFKVRNINSPVLYQ